MQWLILVVFIITLGASSWGLVCRKKFYDEVVDKNKKDKEKNKNKEN